MLVVNTLRMSLPCQFVVADVPSRASLPGRVQCDSPDWSVCASSHPSALNSSGHVVAAQYLDAGPSSSWSIDAGCVGICICGDTFGSWRAVSSSTIQFGISAGLRSSMPCPSSHRYSLPFGWIVGGASTCPPMPRMSMPTPSEPEASLCMGWSVKK